MTRITSILAITMAMGCIETGINKDEEPEVGPEPDILCDPPAIAFPGTAVGEMATAEFTVSNIGNGSLEVDDIVVGSGDEVFSVLGPDFSFILAPGEQKSVEVAYEPTGPEETFGVVQVLSNDPDGDNSTVDLLGYGLLPDLEISPNTYSFGDYFVPCGESVELTLTNVGDEVLEVTDATYASGGQLMYDSSQLAFPFTLAPSESTSVWVDFMPTDAISDAGTFTVSSNDPDGDEVATQDGNGIWTSRQTETFTTPGAPPVDVLIAIDQSGSMDAANQADVEQGFPLFVQELQAISDWRLLLITDAHSQCTTTGVLDPTTPNVGTILTNNAFNGSHDDNTGNNYTEQLLRLSHMALTKTGPGNCNEGFLRSGALLHIIVISDEPEQSNQTAAYWVSQFENFVADPALLRVSAVVDPSDDAGYEQAVTLTGGSSLDIGTNWGANFTDIATEVLAGIQSYSLANPAEPSTVVVEVNGTATYDYTYDPAAQAVTINTPTIGEKDVVEISYSVPATCN